MTGITRPNRSKLLLVSNMQQNGEPHTYARIGLHRVADFSAGLQNRMRRADLHLDRDRESADALVNLLRLGV